MINCKYTKTQKIGQAETTTSVQVSDDSNYGKTAPILLKEVWDKFEQEEPKELKAEHV